MTPRLVTLALLLCLLAGCKPAAPVDPAPAPPPYAELAASYNERLDVLDRFFCNTVVTLRWVDEEGERHHEQGDGHIQFRRYADEEVSRRGPLTSPARVAMDIHLLGNTAYWLGCDATRFWWVDVLHEDTAYVAHHENFGRPCCEPAGIPLHPIELINLLGLDKLDPAAQPLSLAPSPTRPTWALERLTGFGPERLTLDSRTLEAQRVELLDARGEAVMTAELTEYQPVEITNLGPPLWPRLPRRVEIRNAEDTLEITLTLSEPFDARRDPRKLRDAAFSFETVARGIPGVDRIVILDAACLDEADAAATPEAAAGE